MSRRGSIKFVFIVAAFIGLLAGAFALANYVTNNTAAQEFVGQLGYLGVFIAAVIAGLNAVVPIPAATLTPVFTAAGMTLPFIVVALVLGTVVADLTGFYFGRLSADTVATRYPKTYTFFTDLTNKHRHLVALVVLVYAAVFPFPNEAILIPLAIAGIPILSLIPSLIVGNIIHQSSLAYGFENIFQWLLM